MLGMATDDQLEEFSREREVFDALIASGVSVERANALMIERINRSSVS